MEENSIIIYEGKENEKVLPVCISSPLKAYLPLAITSNIITANSGDYNWILENFIQIYKNDKFGKVEMFPHQPFIYFDQFRLHTCCLDESIIELEKINFIDDIIRWIDHKNYVIVYVNEYLLPMTRLYQSKNFLHSQFIFGYDNVKRIFKILNFSDKTQGIEIIDMPYEVLEKAFYDERTKELYKKVGVSEALKGKEFCIYLLKYKGNDKYYNDYHFNKDNMIKKLEQYITGENTSLDTAYFTGIIQGKWGVQIYDDMVLQGYDKGIDLRACCLLYEHKYFMQKRLALFDERIGEEYQQVVDNAKKLKQLCIKYNITLNEKYLLRIADLFMQIKRDDIRYIGDVVHKSFIQSL